MKTIAVLTDFSRRSEHAAMYALHIARKIKADVLLYNAFLVPASSPHAADHGWPAEDYDEIKKSTEKKLNALARKLKNELKEDSFPWNYLPAINYQCEEGAIANNIAELEEDKSLVLIVMATHGTDDISAFMMGNNCRQVIDAASTPLLIVPENCSIKNIEKFTFAMDIVHNDIEYIKSLSTLAKLFSAELLIANVSRHSHATEDHQMAINAFKKEIMHKINYSRVYYRNIPNDNVKEGLDWLIENIRFDILVMVHRKGDLSDFFFKPSITKKIADHAYIPLLVYPYPVSVVPEF
ncbi:MAG TPA: universal stress protein [Mucilaginibacter sp.]|jgi:nucleotide-binding universal stress UspA family protein